MTSPADSPPDIESVAALKARIATLEGEIDQFAYIVSHDLQAPVRTLQSFGHLLRSEFGEQLGEDGQQYLDFISNAGSQITTLLKGLLLYSRARRIEDIHDRVSLDEAWQQACAKFSEEQRQALQIVGGALGHARGNRDALIALLQHLLDNAVQNAHPERPLQVRIRAQSADGWRQLELRDNGVGIPEDLLGAACEVFRRVHAENTGRAGMGLAICREIVQRHGGVLRLESPAEGGLSLQIRLPDGA